MENQTTMQRILLTPGSDLSFLHETPTDWAPNSFSGHARHQILVECLIRFGWSRGWTVELVKFPNDGWGDRGVDVILNGSPVDMKSVGLTDRPQDSSRTIDSPAYAGKKRNPYSLTEWLVFGQPGSSVDTWEVALYKHMKPSKHKNLGPYFWKGEVMPFSDLVRILDSRNGRKNQLDNWHNGCRVTAESRYY